MNLRELVETAKGDRSYQALENASLESPSRQRRWQYATQPLKAFPDPATIRALAEVLHVSQQTVVLAAAESCGLRVAETPTLVALLPPSARELSDRQVAALLAVVRAMLEPTHGTTMTESDESERERVVAQLQRDLQAAREEVEAMQAARGQPRDVTSTRPKPDVE